MGSRLLNNGLCCKLCLEQKKLSNSHIIPEFFYKPLYDEKHRMIELSDDSEMNKRIKQKGLYEKILCENCEQLLSPFETYANKILNVRLEAKRRKIEDVWQIEHVDYEKFKIFEMSLLWRASVSKHINFTDVKLGPHEENLRKLIISRNPGKYHEYGCIIIYNYAEDMQEIQDMIITPMKFRTEDGHICYIFFFGGLSWIFVVSSHSNRYTRNNLFMSEQGILSIFITFENDTSFYNSILRRAIRMVEK